MQSTISVVIPAFNSTSTISTAITSALSQSMPPDEVIVVDDGSTDATAEVVRSFGNKVRLLTQPNQGSAVARQTGTSAATSDYIAYLDADDWWPNEKISTCKKILAHEKVFFLLADLRRARPNDPPEDYLARNSTFFPRAMNYMHDNRVETEITDLYKLPSGRGLSLLLDGFPVFPSTMLVRRDVIEAVGGWDGRFRRCQDFDLGLRIVRQFPMHYLDSVQAILGLHDVNDDETSYLIKQFEGDIRVLRAHLNAESHNSYYRHQIEKTVALKLYGLGNSYLNAGKIRQARQAYNQCIRVPGKRLLALFKWILLLRPS